MSTIRRITSAFLATTTMASLTAGALPGAAAAAEPWWQADGANWTESYITEPDGTVLHADVLRPADLPLNAKVPVIMTVSPYLNHSGQTGAVGTYDPTGSSSSGPSTRWQDFIEGTDLFRKGYAYVMVDLRGEGGSTGCWDWGGPGEQADVKAAVQWAAAQPWSTGRVGMYGKSYDGGTGVIGEAQRPRGLAAVVSQEPVYHWYDYLYTNGVRFINSVVTPAEFDAIAANPGQTGDTPQYNVNAVNDFAKPGCSVFNVIQQGGDDNRDSPFWQQRDVITESIGHKIPFFLTQGFLENNTKPLGAWDFFNGLKGPKHAWFAMSDHIRGNDVDGYGGAGMAPQPWFGQVMRFLNHFVKGLPLSDPSAATDRDPAVAVQTNDGSWRAEQAWPPLDTRELTEPVNPGTYTDASAYADKEDGGSSGNPGVWTISPSLPHAAHLAGVPRAALDVTTTVPDATLSVDVYDIHPNGSAMLLSRTAQLLRAVGEQQVYPELYGNDWLINAGDRVGILVTSANDGWWTPVNTQSTVTVNPGSVVSLPFLAYQRPADQNLSGYKVPTRLGTWVGGAGSLTIPAATITAGTTRSFVLPAEQVDAPGDFNRGAFGLGESPGGHDQGRAS